MSNVKIKFPKEKITDFCHRYGIIELALFGSVLRSDFNSDSDIDVLVTFAPEAHHSIYDLAYIQDELKAILGREVDLVEKAGLRNPFRRHHILNNMEVIYAS